MRVSIIDTGPVLDLWLVLTVVVDMFRALKKSGLPAGHVFSVTVGASSKQTEASWHLLEPADVIGTISMLNNSSSAQEY
jgi:trehalose 6-phosphate synthase/phosphatase